MAKDKYAVSDCTHSFTGLGAVWIVFENHGECGCGEDLILHVAYCAKQKDAEDFAEMKNREFHDDNLLAAMVYMNEVKKKREASEKEAKEKDEKRDL